MYQSETKIRVRYADTDQMGFVYYGRYLEYLEVARTDAMRELGVRYADLEKKENIALPVTRVDIRYKRPAHYDNDLILRTTIPEMPTSRIAFETEILNLDERVINTARVELCFIDITTGRPTKPPKHLLDQLRPHFE
jgi:acyl-CoA thioester hydrolase